MATESLVPVSITTLLITSNYALDGQSTYYI